MGIQIFAISTKYSFDLLLSVFVISSILFTILKKTFLRFKFHSFVAGTADPNPSIYAMQLPPPPPPPGCSESEFEDRSFANQQQQQHHIVPPPPDLKVVVDKLADYVSRNGESFEEQVKKKKDFDFLKSDNIYYPYYLYKKQQCILEVSVMKAQKKKGEMLIFHVFGHRIFIIEDMICF